MKKKKTLKIIIAILVVIVVSVSAGIAVPVIKHNKHISSPTDTIEKTVTQYILDANGRVVINDGIVKACKIPQNAIKVSGLKEITGFESNTEIIQSAIDKVNENGGGVVVLPKGEFGFTSLTMKENVTLFIPEGCVMNSVAQSEYSAYVCNHTGIINAEKANNICITGGGTINGNGDTYFEQQGELAPVYRLKTFNMYAKVIQSAKQMKTPLAETETPAIIKLDNCDGVEISNIKLNQSPSDSIQLNRCKRTDIENVVINNTLFNSGCNGININEAIDISVKKCFISTGGNGILVQSEKYKAVRINVSHCIVCTMENGFEIGGKTNNNIQDITVENFGCYVPDGVSAMGSAVAVVSADGAKISNVKFNNITSDGVASPAVMWLGDRLSLKKSEIGSIHDIIFKDIISTNAELPVVIVGNENKNIYNIDINHLELAYAQADENLSVKELNPEMEDEYIIADLFKAYSAVGKKVEYYSPSAYGVYTQWAENVTVKNDTYSPREKTSLQAS